MKKNRFNRFPILLLLLSVIVLTNLIFSWNMQLNNSFSIIPVLLFSVSQFLIIGLLFITRQEKTDEKMKFKRENDHSASTNSNYHRQVTEQKDPEELISHSLSHLGDTKNTEKFGKLILSNMAKEYDTMQAIFYCLDKKKKTYKMLSGYAVLKNMSLEEFSEGEGFAGQAAKEKSVIILKNIPDNYRIVKSGLGESQPKFIYFVPLVYNNKALGIIEFSIFKELSETKSSSLNSLIHQGGQILHEIMTRK